MDVKVVAGMYLILYYGHNISKQELIQILHDMHSSQIQQTENDDLLLQVILILNLQLGTNQIDDLKRVVKYVSNLSLLLHKLVIVKVYQQMRYQIQLLVSLNINMLMVTDIQAYNILIILVYLLRVVILSVRQTIHGMIVSKHVFQILNKQHVNEHYLQILSLFLQIHLIGLKHGMVQLKVGCQLVHIVMSIHVIHLSQVNVNKNVHLCVKNTIHGMTLLKLVLLIYELL